MNEFEAIIARKETIDELIRCHQKNKTLLLDFAIGYKKSSHDTLLPRHFQNDPLRLAATLKNLHQQMRELEKERLLLYPYLKK
jgi:hypothetical protein